MQTQENLRKSLYQDKNKQFITPENFILSSEISKQLETFNDFFIALHDSKLTVTRLPGFTINPNFKGKIKLLGDYIDRGKESSMCFALVDYLTIDQLGQITVLRGNHETIFTDGNYYIYTYQINKMLQKGKMKYVDIETKDEKSVVYSHTLICKRHVPLMFKVLKKNFDLEKNDTKLLDGQTDVDKNT